MDVELVMKTAGQQQVVAAIPRLHSHSTAAARRGLHVLLTLLAARRDAWTGPPGLARQRHLSRAIWAATGVTGAAVGRVGTMRLVRRCDATWGSSNRSR